jgi:hypothetical protein
LGARVLEEIAPQQADISEHLSGDLELRKNPEDWSEGFRSLMGNALPASRKLLWAKPPISEEDVLTLTNAMYLRLDAISSLVDTVFEISVNTREYERRADLPQGSLEFLVDDALEVNLDLDLLISAVSDAASVLREASQNGMGDDVRAAFDTAQQAYGSLLAQIDGPTAALLDSVAEIRRARSADPDQAGPSGVRRIDWSPDGGVTWVGFSAQSQSELRQELQENPTFREWADLAWAGWALGSAAAFIAYELWNGKRIPK